MLYPPLTFVEYNCHNPSSLIGQNNGSIFWFFRRLLESFRAYLGPTQHASGNAMSVAVFGQ